MTPVLTLPFHSDSLKPWALLFAKEPEQDLDFDDGLEDMDDPDPKPPSRRPLVLILLLLVVAAVGYFLMDPGAFSSLTRMVTAPGSKSADSETRSESQVPRKAQSASTSQPPVPSFQEGQLVAVVPTSTGSLSMQLSGDPQGKQPGPKVKTGELLTILDGTLVNNTWIYLVHTKSGASGWIGEQQLKAQS